MNNKYRVAYIDDEEKWIDLFVNINEGEFSGVEIELQEDLDSLIHDISSCSLDAVVLDFNLHKKNPNIHFNGADIVQKLDLQKRGFPSFILASYEDDAENTDIDINKIYPKKDYFSKTSEAHKRTNRKIVKQIESYQRKLASSEEELVTLLKKRETAPLTLKKKAD